jgi:stalled ribosome rescue protein Dom34
MSDHYHALVWIDHQQAKIFHFDASGADREVVRSTHPHQHLHHKAHSPDSGHVPPDQKFLHEVADALAPAEAILITGPGSAKTELMSYIHRAQPELARRVSGVDTLDHPTDRQLAALARAFFDKDAHLRALLRS